MRHAQTVSKTCVVRTRVSEVADTQLMNAPQPLHLTAIDQINDPTIAFTIKGDVIIEWIAEDLV